MQIAFYKAPGDWTDRLIRWTTRSPYSHCELLLTQPSSGYTAKAISSSPRDGGVRVATISFWPDRWDMIEIPWGEEAYVRRKVGGQAAKRYDLLGAITSQLPRPLGGSQARWFCSELLAWGLDLGAPETLSPGELYLRLVEMNRAFHVGRAAA